jgi:branched-chain amino acid transport system ATP-binding protein
MTMPLSVLKVGALSKSYGGVQAVRGVSFDVGAGEIVALIGPNGAGKTTCFNMLNGQIAPDAGCIILLGQDITGWPAQAVARLGVGRTFQVATIFPTMTVRENVQVALQVAPAARASQLFNMWRSLPRMGRGAANDLLELVGMRDAAERPCSELAYGDVKRLELAMALAHAPKLLLMDEPTAGMAPQEREALMQLVTRIARERSIGVLFTEHDMDAVFAHADHVLVLDRGLLIAQGLPQDVRRDPHVRAVYLGEEAT